MSSHTKVLAPRRVINSANTSLGSIGLGYVYTDEAIQNSATFPTVAIESGFEKNPQMIMWDPATYPDVKGIADLGTNKVTVRYFGGAAYMDYLTTTGILSPEQVDGSYTGDPALFIADEGKAAQQGFGSAEPFLYESELADWGKPVAYEYINDIGWKNYAQSIATKPENITEYADCFKALVPMIQQSTVDYLADPSHGNKVILDATASFGEAFGWTYTEGAAAYGVETIKKDGLQANDPKSGVHGQFDFDRIQGLIDSETLAVGHAARLGGGCGHAAGGGGCPRGSRWEIACHQQQRGDGLRCAARG